MSWFLSMENSRSYSESWEHITECTLGKGTYLLHKLSIFKNKGINSRAVLYSHSKGSRWVRRFIERLVQRKE
jgi:hypothetical protein